MNDLIEQLDNFAITLEVAEITREAKDEIRRLERAAEQFQKWLTERADWLRSEYLNGGNYEHLKTREDECRYIASRFEKLLTQRTFPMSKRKPTFEAGRKVAQICVYGPADIDYKSAYCQMEVVMENGQMAAVPWVRVVWPDGNVEMVNCAKCACIRFEPDSDQGPVSA